MNPTVEFGVGSVTKDSHCCSDSGLIILPAREVYTGFVSYGHTVRDIMLSTSKFPYSSHLTIVRMPRTRLLLVAVRHHKMQRVRTSF